MITNLIEAKEIRNYIDAELCTCTEEMELLWTQIKSNDFYNISESSTLNEVNKIQKYLFDIEKKFAIVEGKISVLKSLAQKLELV